MIRERVLFLSDRPLPRGFQDCAANRFSSKNTKTKRQQIAQAIEALEGAGLLLLSLTNISRRRNWEI